MIGFGLLSFVMVLVWRSYVSLGTVDTDAMREAEPIEDTAVDAPAPGDGAAVPLPAGGMVRGS